MPKKEDDTSSEENEREEQTVTLKCKAFVQPGALHLRTQLAEAKGDGFSVELAASVSGSILVTYRPEGKNVPPGSWTTYCITPQSLVNEVLALHNQPNLT